MTSSAIVQKLWNYCKAKGVRESGVIFDSAEEWPLNVTLNKVKGLKSWKT